ncbi:MAG: sensor histidine kinase [Alphaproteobacteria bacterium]|nr:sensor histidine kinase [Alphaproteobacteria bacterium]
MLILGTAQSLANYRLEMNERRVELVDAAQRSAASVRSRMLAGQVLLETLAPGEAGVDCAQRLAEIRERLVGFVNLIRFDSIGRVACAAAGAPADPDRKDRPWFKALDSGGRSVTITADPGAVYADTPSIIASFRDEDAQGRFSGVLTAVLSLASLRPARPAGAPAHSEVAIVDAQGRYISSTDLSAFPAQLAQQTVRLARVQSLLWQARSRRGQGRVFAAAPLVGQDVFVVISAPDNVFSFALTNPALAVAFPIAALVLGLAAVFVVADRGVVRWIAYLRRFATVYANGRYSVRPRRALEGPPEIQDLARTLGAMADVIAARDRALKESLQQKDALMREIHHRVRNNLQVISSLLSLQQRALSDPGAQAAMSDTRQRITALALIYRALYQGADLRRVDLRPFMDELISHVVSAEGAAPAQISLDVDPVDLDPDRLAPLALFAVEAITHARKHGYAGPDGRLDAAFKVEGDLARLTISDAQGKGRAEAARNDGIGQTLMKAFARQMRGGVDLKATGEGLVITLSFPLGASPHAAPRTAKAA